MTRATLNWRGLRLWPWLPVAFAAVYLVLLAVDFRAIVQSLYTSADLVSAPVIGELFGQRAPGAEVVLGNFPWYEPLWYENLTRGLPAHRQLWEVAPFLLSVAGIGAVAWATARAANRWAAAMVVVVLVCASPTLMTYQFAWSIHSATFVHVCVLGAFLVLCAERGGYVGPLWAHVPLTVAVAGFTALGFASDKLLAPAGVAPFALAGLGLAWLMPGAPGRRVAATALAAAAGALVGGAAIAHAARAAHIHAFAFPITFATFDHLAPNVRILAESVAYLGNGDFGGAKLTARSVLALACAVALAAGAWAAWRFARTWLRSLSAAARPYLTGREAARAAHLAFWILAGAALSLTFLVSSVPADRFSARYVLSVLYALVVLSAVAAAASRWIRGAFVVGVCAVVTAGIVTLASGDIQNDRTFVTGQDSGPLARFARARGVTLGYSGYWTAAPLTWQTKASVRVYPVQTCGDGSLCPFDFHRISSWYTPRPATRSMLIVDPSHPEAAAPPGPTRRFGKPRETARIGRLTVYVYPYDIASRFG